MTPQGWTLDNLALCGAAWMFGGGAVAAVFGVLMARRRSPERGIGSGMLLWGAGNLLIVGWVALFVFVETRVLPLPPSRCEPLPNVGGKPMRQRFYRLPSAASAPAAPMREVWTAPEHGLCAEEAHPQPDAVRVRDADVSSTRPLIEGEFADSDKPLAIMVTWTMFGGIAVLIGLVMLSVARPQGQSPRQLAAKRAEVAAWRKTIGGLLGQLGLLVFLAAFIGPMFLDGSESRGLQFGIRAAAAALGIWCVAALLAATVRWGGAAFMLVFTGALLGIAELIRFSG